MKCKNLLDARKQAKINAAYFRRPYRVFFDTAGNARCERYAEPKIDGQETFDPPISKHTIVLGEVESKE